MEDGAKFWLLSGYSGAGNDIVLTKVDADGTLTAQAALRTGEIPRACVPEPGPVFITQAVNRP